MSKVYSSVNELVGKTPLLELTNIEKKFNLKAKIFAKLEFLNPAGSAKDRVALNLIEDAIKKGTLKKDNVIIEPTSGNTGIGLAMIGTSMGYNVIIVMPDTMSAERIKLIKGYGAEVILSNGKLGMKGAIELAEKLAKEKNGVVLGQFDNMANPEAHYKTTGPEIYSDLDGKVDIFVASVGTGGTITGTGKFLKEQNKNIKVVAVEPASSPFLSKGTAGAHKIQGIGAGFIPKVLDTSIYDEVITVTDDDAYSFGKLIGNTEGVLVGISSGAALWGAIEVAKHKENIGKNIVVLLPDSGDRYLSTTMFD